MSASGTPQAVPITFTRASRWYGPVIALNDVTVSMPPGITGLLGPNGAGKTTFLKLAAGLLRPVLHPRLFETRVVTISAGDEMTPEILLEVLDEGGYRREDPVASPGQVARRGGILDVFPPDCDAPVRIEFLGDTVETLRSFDPETQRTTAALHTLEILPLTDVFAPRSVLDALRRGLPQRFAGHRDLPALLEKIERGALVVDDLADLLPLVPGATVAPGRGDPWRRW